MEKAPHTDHNGVVVWEVIEEAFGDAFLRQWEGQVEGKSHYDVRAGDQTVSDGDISLLK